MNPTKGAMVRYWAPSVVKRLSEVTWASESSARMAKSSQAPGSSRR